MNNEIIRAERELRMSLLKHHLCILYKWDTDPHCVYWSSKTRDKLPHWRHEAKLKKMFIFGPWLGDFFLRWADRYSNNFLSGLSSYKIFLNVISTPFVLVFPFFTFVWVRLLASVYSPFYKYASLGKYPRWFISLFIMSFDFILSTNDCVYKNQL